VRSPSRIGSPPTGPVGTPPAAQPKDEASVSTNAPSVQGSAPEGLQARPPQASSPNEHSRSRRSPPPAIEAGTTSAVEVSGRAVPSDNVVIDIDPPPTAATLREQIAGTLDRLPFAAPPGTVREAQMALEREYIPWATGVAEKRQAAFGEAHYSIGVNHQKDFREAVLPAVFDFGRQFISSSSRSPVRNALATKFAPSYAQVGGQRVNVGEFSNTWDAALLGGVAGGITAHVVYGTLLSAIDREARKANMPQLKPVDLKALVPDPGDVQVSIVNGKKVYWRATDDAHADLETREGAMAGRPSKTQLQEEVMLRRQALASVQDALEAKNWGLFVQPAVTGAFNMMRRVVMPASSMLQPASVYIGSVVASGTAGAVTKLGLGLLKPAAQADVNDLVGGKQHVNLFAIRLPDASQASARFSDIGNLPGRAAAVAVETAALGAHFVAGPWRDSGSAWPSLDASLARIGDVMRSVTANTLASVFSTATGPLVASVARDGLTAPLSNEAKDSPAYLLQQVSTSATNEYVWQVSKEVHKNSAFDLAGSLDRWRARTDRPHGE